MKMTFQPKKRSRSKVHGFRARMSSKAWLQSETEYSGRKKGFSCKKVKRKKKIISIGHNICGLSS